MSELDTQLRGLRDDLNAAIPPPDFAGVAGRARQRTMRRRVVGAIVAVLVVSVAVPVLRSLPSGEQAADQQPQVRPTYSVDFADADHGYALRGECAKAREDCEFTLLATSDGGRSWANRNLPESNNPVGSYFTSSLVVLGPDVLVLDRPFKRDDQLGLSGYERLRSDDGGRTWQELPQVYKTDGVLPIEPLAKLATCIGASRDYSCGRVVSVHPATGLSALVPAQPALVDPIPGWDATADGKWWTFGRDPVTHRRALGVSVDGGRSWSTSALDVPGTVAPGQYAVVERNGVMYATLSGAYDQGFTTLAVFRSTDDGKSWTRTWRVTDTDRMSRVAGTPVVAADGRLILPSATGTTMSSRDGGHTFEVADHQLTGTVQWTHGGYLLHGRDGFALSQDGLTWRRFSVG